MSERDEPAAALCRALASEMRDMGTLVEALAEVLASDTGVVERHLGRLQQFDGLAQQIGEGARLLDHLAGGDCVKQAIGRVRLEGMQARLKAGLEAA